MNNSSVTIPENGFKIPENGFKKWSTDHADNRRPGETNPIILTDPLTYGPNKPEVIVVRTGTA